jgi:hypothetical protein
MPDPPKHRNAAGIWALVCALGALSTNFVFFVSPPIQVFLPWLSLVLAPGSLVLLGVRLRRAVTRSQIYRGKALSIVFGVLTLLFAVSQPVFVCPGALSSEFGGSRQASGYRTPHFRIPASPLPLDRLFQLPPSDPSSPAPKAVLLIFYRRYW